MKLPPPISLRFAKNGVLRWVIGSVALCITIGSIAVHQSTPSAPSPTAVLPSFGPDEPIHPIKSVTDLDPRKIALGQKLFDDPRLSANNQVSCSSCHNLKTGGTDRKVRSIGIHGAVGVINAPTVFNSGFNFSQFWDGRADTLENQIDGPLESSTEMGSTWPQVIAKLESSPDYVRSFRQVYGDEIRSEHVKDSIAQFERSLSTPNSRFDRYLRHEPGALTIQEKEGYKLFKSLGCSSCHQGVNVGGNMYQKLGVMAPYFADRGNITIADRGRFNVTGDPRDMYMFKVPSLRNVELSPPYFHDGSAATLPEAVVMMATYQLGRHLTDQEVRLIVDFLKTLTGERNGQRL